MLRRISAAALCIALATAAYAADEKEAPKKANEAPAQAVGFVGKLEGTVTSFKKNGNTLNIKVTKAEAGDKNAAKDVNALVGLDVPITVRWEKKDGEYKPVAEDQDFVKALKKGDALVLEVNYIESLKVLRLTAVPKKAEAAK